MSNKKYLLVGNVTKIDGKQAKCRRWFDGSGSLADTLFAAVNELYRRKDGGAPWFGDSVKVITPSGYEIEVGIPWPLAKEYM